MTRGIVKWLATAGAFVFTLVGGAIAQDAVNGIGNAMGATSFVVAIYRHLSALGYAHWYVVGGSFLAGVAVVLHAEWALRQYRMRRAVERLVHFVADVDPHGRITVCIKHGVDSGSITEGSISGRIYVSEPKVTKLVVTLILVFAEDIADPIPSVFADRVIAWREVRATSRYIAIELDLRSAKAVTFSAIVRPQAWSSIGRYAPTPMRWEDAHVVPREHLVSKSNLPVPVEK
jgi:hypothetical protein